MIRFPFKNYIQMNVILTSLLLVACGGGGTDSSSNVNTKVEEPDWWNVAMPVLASEDQRPTISLVGPQTVILSVGETYEEQGAVVLDPQEGDISSTLSIRDRTNNESAGDYLVQYSSTDSDGNSAIVVTRVVRVIDANPTTYSLRPLGKTAVNMGYIEHLPDDYGLQSNVKHPLIIYNHGSGANAQFSPTGEHNALDLVLNNYGPPSLLQSDRWDTDLPFVVLMPQYGFVENSEPEDRLKHFVEFAIQTYQVDPDRVYMMGWSQGGFITLEYAMAHPETLAAVISMSAGIPFVGEPPAHFCQLESLPIWAFHGARDPSIPVIATTDLGRLLNSNCQPQWAPKITIFSEQYHNIHHWVSDLQAMTGGSQEYKVDEEYSDYSISIYDWLMQFSRDE